VEIIVDGHADATRMAAVAFSMPNVGATDDAPDE
jgi:hypothetical protein